MELKYEFTDETMRWGVGSAYGEPRILHRIKALRDFSNVKRGDLGGWVENEHNLSQFGICWIYDNAKLYNEAMIHGNSVITDNAQVFGHAKVYDYSRIGDNSMVYGSAKIGGYATILANATIFECSTVNGNAKICGCSKVCGSVDILGDAIIKSSDDYITITGFDTKTGTLTFYRCINDIICVTCDNFLHYDNVKLRNCPMDEFRAWINKTKTGNDKELYLMLSYLVEKKLSGTIR